MLSVIVYGRNDSHGYNLHKRAALSLNCIAEMLDRPDDEIIFVDYNTPDNQPSFPEAIQDTLTARAKQRLRIVRVRSLVHDRLRGRTHLMAVESLARNIGARRSRPGNRWLLSTNTDMILVPHTTGSTLSSIVAGLEDGFYTLPRFELPESFWEALDRRDPVAAIERVGTWAGRCHLQDVVYGGEDILFDAPGDFQLVLRQDFFDIGGFDERMILGWHVDSNISRRMRLLRGDVSSAAGHLFGYHCDHTRQATLMHGHDRVEDDWEVFVSSVTAPGLPDQMETWGLAGEVLEEFTLAASPSREGIAAIERILGPIPPRVTKSLHNDAGFNDLHYPPEHVLPYLCDLLSSMPRHLNLLYAGCRRRMFDLVVQAWAALGFTGDILRPEGFERLGEGGSVLPLDEAVRRAPLILVEFGYGSADEPGGVAAPSRPGAWSADDSDRLTRVMMVFEAALEADRLAPPAPGEPLRYFMAINAIYNLFESAINANLSITYTPFSSRLRHGYRLRQTLPAPTGERRAMGRWLQGRLGRREPVTFNELRHLLRLARGLLVDGAAPDDLPATADRLLAQPLLALLDMPGLGPFLGVEEAAIDGLRRRLGAARGRSTLGTALALPVAAGAHAAPAAALNRVACIEDWEQPDWIRWAYRHFGGSNAYNHLDRGGWAWERIHLLYGLDRLGVLTPDARVLVVAWKPDAFYAVLTQHVAQVDVLHPAPSVPADTAAWERPIELVLGDRLTVVHGGPDTAALPEAAYDAVVFVEGALFAHGGAGVVPLLAWADRRLKPEGRLAWSADVLLDDDRPGPWLTGAMVRDGGFDRLLDSHTGYAATGPFLADVTETTLDRIQDLDAGPAHHGAFILAERDLHRIRGVWFRTRRAATPAAGWEAVREALTRPLAGSMLALMRPSNPERRGADGVAVSPADPAGLILFGPYLHLEAGTYALDLDVRLDSPATEDGRPALTLAVIAGDDPAPVVWRDICAGDAAGGMVRTVFEVCPERAAAGSDAAAFEFCLSAPGGVGLTVRDVRLSPLVRGTVSPRVDLRLLHRMEPTRLARSAGAGVAVSAEEGPGDLLYGPRLALPAGAHRLRLRLSLPSGSEPSRPLVTIRAMAGDEVPFLWRDVLAGEVVDGFATVDVVVPDAVSLDRGCGATLEFRVGHLGGIDLGLAGLDLVSGDGPATGGAGVDLALLPRLHTSPIAWRDGAVVRVGREADAGLALFGPYLGLPAGDYRLELVVDAPGVPDDRPLVGLEVAAGEHPSLMMVDLAAVAFADGVAAVEFAVEPALAAGPDSRGAPFEVRLTHLGGADLAIIAVRLMRLPEGRRARPPETPVDLAVLPRLHGTDIGRRGPGGVRVGRDDPAGLLLRGPYLGLPAGGYRLEIAASAPGAAAEHPLLGVEVVARNQPPLLMLDRRAGVFADGPDAIEFVVSPDLAQGATGGGEPFEFRLTNLGGEDVTIHAVRLTRLPDGQGARSPEPPVDLALLPRLTKTDIGRRDGGRVTAGRDEGAGLLLFGPYQILPAGGYRLAITASAPAAAPDTPLLGVEIVAEGQAPLLLLDRPAGAFADGPHAIEFAVTPDLAAGAEGAGSPFEFRLTNLGGEDVTIHAVRLTRLPDGQGARSPEPPVDLALLPRLTKTDIGRRDGGRVTAGRDEGAGLLLFGPYIRLPAGGYRLEVAMDAPGTPDDGSVLGIEVKAGDRPPLLMVDLSRRAFAPGPAAIEFTVPPELAAGGGTAGVPFEVRLTHLGGVEVAIRGARLTRLPDGCPAAPPDPVVDLVLLPRLRASEIGRRDGASVVAAREAAAGTLLFGPYLSLPAGAYRVEFRIRARSLLRRNRPALEVAVVSGGAALREPATFTTPELGGKTTVLDFVVPDGLEGGGGVECVFTHTGNAALEVREVRLRRL